MFPSRDPSVLQRRVARYRTRSAASGTSTDEAIMLLCACPTVALLFSLLLSLSPNTNAMAMSIGEQRPSQYYPPFFEGLPSMVGKTVVITGCSKGLGYVTSRALVEKGAMVYMLNRKSVQSDEALTEITSVCTGPDQPVVIHCDLLDFSSVRNAAAEIRKCIAKSTTNHGIDVLCNNAGIMLQPDMRSVDGYDITASTNVLSHFLLTEELFPEVEKCAIERGEARIVNMSSGSGYDPSLVCAGLRKS